MTQPAHYQHWLHIVPPSGLVLSELQEDEWIVWCEAPTEPPPSEIPSAAGTVEGTLGDHRYTLDWEYTEGAFHVNDLDLILSLDGEIG